MVLHADRDVITGVQPGIAQQAGESIRGRVKLGKGLHLARIRHDHGRLVGEGGEMCTGIHGRKGSRCTPPGGQLVT